MWKDTYPPPLTRAQLVDRQRSFRGKCAASSIEVSEVAVGSMVGGGRWLVVGVGERNG